MSENERSRAVAEIVQVRERPILFSGPMVRAILGDEKTQTRRVVKPQPEPETHSPWQHHESATWQWSRGKKPVNYADDERVCPYGPRGDRLWVRERAWMQPSHVYPVGSVVAPDGTRWLCSYDATISEREREAARSFGVRLRPSIRMPRWACRLTLRIVSISVERLHTITETDAAAEGVGDEPLTCERFRDLWKKINGAESWDANPWVWVVDFRRIESKAEAA